MGKKIWVVDDDLSILEVIKIVLEGEGYETTPIQNIPDLKSLIKKDRPDLILMDVWISNQDGTQACRSIKNQKSTKDIPIVLISALSETKEILKKSRANDLVKKPFDIYNLLDIVRKYTSK